MTPDERQNGTCNGPLPMANDGTRHAIDSSKALACRVCHETHKFLHKHNLCNKCNNMFWKLKSSGFDSEQIKILISML